MFSVNPSSNNNFTYRLPQDCVYDSNLEKLHSLHNNLSEADVMLHNAVCLGDVKQVSAMIRNDLGYININSQDSRGRTPLMKAILLKNEELVLELLNYNEIDLTFEDEDKNHAAILLKKYMPSLVSKLSSITQNTAMYSGNRGKVEKLMMLLDSTLTTDQIIENAHEFVSFHDPVKFLAREFA